MVITAWIYVNFYVWGRWGVVKDSIATLLEGGNCIFTLLYACEMTYVLAMFNLPQ